MMRVILLLGLASLCATPTFAGPDGVALTNAGLIGTHWAIDCSKPASGENYLLSYSIGPNGVPVEAMQSAPGADKVRELRNVQIISTEWMLYTTTDTDKEVVNILTSVKGNRKKSWWSVGKDGTNYILDGQYPDGGAPPWFIKCE